MILSPSQEDVLHDVLPEQVRAFAVVLDAQTGYPVSMQSACSPAANRITIHFSALTRTTCAPSGSLRMAS